MKQSISHSLDDFSLPTFLDHEAPPSLEEESTTPFNPCPPPFSLPNKGIHTKFSTNIAFIHRNDTEKFVYDRSVIGRSSHTRSPFENHLSA